MKCGCACVWDGILVTSGALSANLRVITERKKVYSPCVPFSRKRKACSPFHFLVSRSVLEGVSSTINQPTDQPIDQLINLLYQPTGGFDNSHARSLRYSCALFRSWKNAEASDALKPVIAGEFLSG